MLQLDTIIGLGLAITGALVWLIRLESRVMSHERQITELREAQERHHTELLEELHYIRERIDRCMNGQVSPSQE